MKLIITNEVYDKLKKYVAMNASQMDIKNKFLIEEALSNLCMQLVTNPLDIDKAHNGYLYVSAKHSIYATIKILYGTGKNRHFREEFSNSLDVPREGFEEPYMVVDNTLSISNVNKDKELSDIVLDELMEDNEVSPGVVKLYIEHYINEKPLAVIIEDIQELTVHYVKMYHRQLKDKLSDLGDKLDYDEMQ